MPFEQTCTPAVCTEEIVARTGSSLDQSLVARLRAIDSPDSAHGECFEPLGGVWAESLVWVAGSVMVWLAAALISR
ncbi:MAG TPA: hypothetical protein VHZ53_11220 [Steroidobacteraceae bacterium]|jgi:hypothetical protein|nr:hypothetical protein [Steroidobacteraceae bacterium]